MGVYVFCLHAILTISFDFLTKNLLVCVASVLCGFYMWLLCSCCVVAAYNFALVIVVAVVVVIK